MTDASNPTGPAAHTDRTTAPTATPTDGGFAGCLARLVWMGIGNAALLFSGIDIVHGPTPRRGLLALAGSWAVLAAVRTLDIVALGGTTTQGAPADRGHLARYLVGLTVAAALIAVVALSTRGGT